MFRSIALFALIVLACVIETTSRVAAQTGGDVAPVPGPYQAMPVAPTQTMPNRYSNPGFAQNMPYWMRQRAPQPGGTGPAGNRVIAPNFIPGWVWSPNAPGTQGRGPRKSQRQRQGYYPPTGPQTRPGQWGMPPMGYPWGQPGYGQGYGPGNGQGMWPNSPYGAPQGYGARMQPNQ